MITVYLSDDVSSNTEFAVLPSLDRLQEYDGALWSHLILSRPVWLSCTRNAVYFQNAKLNNYGGQHAYMQADLCVLPN